MNGVYDADTMDQWFLPFHSEQRGNYIRDCILDCDVYLLGRVTYEMLAPYWSSLKNNEMGVAAKLNSVAKIVVSSTLTNPSWNKSTVLGKNAIEEIAKLKQQTGKPILIAGSGTLVHSLAEASLIDEYRLLVHPFIMNKGKLFFKEGKCKQELKLIENRILEKGVLQLCYQVVNSK